MIFIGRTDDEAETPILWPPDTKNWLLGKDPDSGKDWRQEEKGMTEDEMVGWYHWLNGHEFEQAPADSEGQGSLACCSLWGHKESDMTEQLNKQQIPKILNKASLTILFLENEQGEWSLVLEGKKRFWLSNNVVQSLSHIWLSATPWTAECQVLLSFTISQSLLKFMTIGSVMLPSHLTRYLILPKPCWV